VRACALSRKSLSQSTPIQGEIKSLPLRRLPVRKERSVSKGRTSFESISIACVAGEENFLDFAVMVAAYSSATAFPPTTGERALIGLYLSSMSHAFVCGMGLELSFVDISLHR